MLLICHVYNMSYIHGLGFLIISDVISFLFPDFPVYHTAFDSYNWMAEYGDPFFHRHVAG